MNSDSVRDRKITPQENRKWRGEFRRLGIYEIRDQLRRDAIRPYIKQDLARQWLREQERKDQRRSIWTLDAAIAAAVLTFVGILITLILNF